MVKCEIGNHEVPAAAGSLAECRQCHRKGCAQHYEDIHKGYCNDCWYKFTTEEQLKIVNDAKSMEIMQGISQNWQNKMEAQNEQRRDELIHKLKHGDKAKDKKILKIVCPIFGIIIILLIIAMVWFLQNF